MQHLGQAYQQLYYIRLLFTGNPLECNCDIRWITWKGIAWEDSINRELLGVCRSPQNISGVELRDLTPEDFTSCTTNNFLRSLKSTSEVHVRQLYRLATRTGGLDWTGVWDTWFHNVYMITITGNSDTRKSLRSPQLQSLLAEISDGIIEGGFYGNNALFKWIISPTKFERVSYCCYGNRLRFWRCELSRLAIVAVDGG